MFGAHFWRQWRSFFFGKGKSTTGDRGERAAARFLEKEQGFRLIARNWRNPWNRREEIDLVCLDRGILVFVEVKTRTGTDPLRAYHAVDARKRRILRSASRAYLQRYAPRDRNQSYRLDVVVVSLNAEARVGEILHFRNLPLFS